MPGLTHLGASFKSQSFLTALALNSASAISRRILLLAHTSWRHNPNRLSPAAIRLERSISHLNLASRSFLASSDASCIYMENAS